MPKSIYQLIRERESIRSYDPDNPVKKDIIEKILEAGRLAPSACNYQPWKFVVISSPEFLKKVKVCYHRQWFKDAPHLLIVKGFKNTSWIRGYDGYNSIETDLAIAMTHLILAAENEGIGTCWIAAFDPAILRQVLDLKDNEVVYAITPLGYPRKGFKKSGNKVRKSPDEIIEFL